MPREISAIVFDMDGLMLDTEPLYKVAWQAASAECGYALDDLLYAKLVGRPTEDCERELVEHFGSDFPLDRFRARWPERSAFDTPVSTRGVSGWSSPGIKWRAASQPLTSILKPPGAWPWTPRSALRLKTRKLASWPPVVLA